MKRVIPYAALFAIVGTLHTAGTLSFLDRWLTDLRYALVTRPAGGDVVLVAVDSRSLLELEVWPWDDGMHATALDNLARSGVRNVALDLALSAGEPAGDEEGELRRALRALERRLVLPVSGQYLRGRLRDAGDGALSVAGPTWSRHATLVTDQLPADSDGKVRRYPTQGDYLGLQRPSLARALVPGSGPAGTAFHVDFGIDVETIPTLSYIDVLRGDFEPSLVRDASVIVGITARELTDPLEVPRFGRLPESVVHALAAESLAQGRELRPVGSLPTLLLLLTLCLAFAASGVDLGGARGSVATVATAALLVLLSFVLQWLTPLLIEVVPLALTVAAVCVYHTLRRVELRNLATVVQTRRSRETETLMRHVVSNSFDSIVTLAEDGTVMTFNRMAQMMFGWEESEAIGRHVSEFVRLPRAEEGAIRGAERRVRGRALYETEGLCRDGRRFPMELAVTWIAAEGLKRRVMFMRDITERKAQQEALRYRATHDSLTDLPNRTLLQERLEEAIGTARQHGWPVAFLLLDLDRFKEINDTLGHQIGDLLLRKIGRRLESSVREADTVARLGGDEFAVLMGATGLEQAQQMARRLMDCLQEPFQVEGLSLQVETSVGITLYPEHGNAPPALIQRADVAMYTAKKERRGVVVYDPEQDFSSLRMLALTGDLRRAIHDNGLSMHFQPKICARSGLPTGVEALARWRHPTHGDVPPDEFVSLAEHGGLIQALTQWVLETALRQGAAWAAEGIELDISVNLSARNLLDDQLPVSLESLLASTGFPVERLTLEITESVIMEDPKRALEVLTRLHALGAAISIDDFGTGYSSLGYLKKLPAGELKIDKSFVMDMDRQPDDRTIVHSTIELAHNLGLAVVAEGVSSHQIWEELRRLGCDVGQGYHFSRPLPPDALARWYREAMAGLPVVVGTDVG